MADLADIDRGTKYSINGTYTDDDGDPIDITASEIFFTLKTERYDSDADDSDALIRSEGTVVNGPLGTYAITLTPTDTFVTPGKHWYSITIDVTGDGSDVKLLASGRAKVVGHPTNRTS